jgi:hypothetical protein
MCEQKSLHSTYVGIQRVKYFYETSSTNFYQKSSQAKLENRWVGINHTRRKSQILRLISRRNSVFLA